MNCEPFLGRLSRVLGSVQERDLMGLASAIASAPRVFAAGEGRSGMVARCFVSGLVRLGHPAFVPGEASAPGPTASDLVVICSASGRTPQMVVLAEESSHAGASVVLLTAAAISPLERIARQTVLLPPLLPGSAMSVAPVPEEEELLEHFRDLYEQAAFLFLECVRAQVGPRRSQAPAPLS